jgi:hypothetical protein
MDLDPLKHMDPTGPDSDPLVIAEEKFFPPKCYQFEHHAKGTSHEIDIYFFIFLCVAILQGADDKLGQTLQKHCKQ